MDFSRISRSAGRRERTRRTAVRHSVLASLELRSFVAIRLSLRQIISQYPSPRIINGEAHNDNDKHSTATHKRQPPTFEPRLETPLDLLSFSQGREDPTARVEAQGPFDIGTHLYGFSTTSERRTTSNEASCDTGSLLTRQPTTLNDGRHLTTHDERHLTTDDAFDDTGNYIGAQSSAHRSASFLQANHTSQGMGTPFECDLSGNSHASSSEENIVHQSFEMSASGKQYVSLMNKCKSSWLSLLK